MLAVTM